MDPEPAAVGADDAALVRLVRSGDREAFGRLVERHMRRAYFAALALVGSREDALDLSQEAFARAFRARRSLDPERPFYAWLYQILRRLCFNFRRDRATRSRIQASPAWLDEAGPSGGAPDPAEALEREERRRRIGAAIDGLPDREREVLVLKEFEGLKYREIAELVGVPLGTVMSRLYAARKRLAGALEAERSAREPADHARAQALMMAELDGEIEADERRELEALVARDAAIAEELARLRRVKEVTSMMTLRKPTDEVWDGYWHSTFRRTERRLGWVLVVAGTLVLSAWGLWHLVESLWADTDTPVSIRLAVVAVLLGTLVLLVSVVREKWFTRHRDPYHREVIR